MKKNLVSVILPVFNAGEYLEQIFQDILNQSYQDIELIVIDDGSTDNSWEIIQRFINNDSRIRAIQVENGGPSKARNLGLEMADGEYIRFIDADDRVPKDSIKKMIEKVKENQCIDMVIGNYRCIPEHNYFKGDTFDNLELEKNEFTKYFIKNVKSFYYGVAWNKLYKNKIIKRYHIHFDEAIDWCEDLCFNLDYYEKCNTIVLFSSNEGVYTYCPRENSITNSLSIRAKEELREIDEICYERVLQYCSAMGLEQVVRLEWKYYNLYYQLSAIVEKKQKYRQKYKKFKELLNQSDVREYIWYKQDDSKLWKFLKFVIKTKLYFVAYFLFYVKGIMVSRLEKLLPRFKSWIQKFLPKIL